MRLIYFDCYSGASGDKILGSLIDAGLSLDKLKHELDKLNVDGFSLSTQKSVKHGLAGTKLTVHTEEQKTHRHLKDIKNILENSKLDQNIITKSIAVFQRLAEAEAKVHGTTIDRIHFHEVGALDAIVDIVGAVIGLDLLGAELIHCSPFATGTGFVKCAHGTIPVPVPATVELLTGFPVKPTEIEAELTTPTGAAILTTLADHFGPMPAMTITDTGYGAGTRDLDIPNHLRVLIGTTEADSIQSVTVDLLETNIDDMNPELFEYVAEKLKEAGAIDIYFTPIHMKKNRPAVMLSVLSPVTATGRVTEVLFRETTSIGLRQSVVNKKFLPREIVTVKTELGEIRIKLCRIGTEIVNLAPEYEDCRKLATETSKPIKLVYELAMETARKMLNEENNARE